MIKYSDLCLLDMQILHAKFQSNSILALEKVLYYFLEQYQLHAVKAKIDYTIITWNLHYYIFMSTFKKIYLDFY